MIGANHTKKQPSLKNGTSLAGLSKQSRGRVVPVPVAPPRLPPSSATNSTAVTPTTTTAKSPFTTGSSFEDSQADDLLSSSNSAVKSVDLEQSQLQLQGSGGGGGGECGNRRTASAAGRRGQLSKLFSLQSSDCSEADHTGSSFLPDLSLSSLVSGGIAALEDAFAGGGKNQVQLLFFGAGALAYFSTNLFFCFVFVFPVSCMA